jgi:type IV pilus assembly protein PilV
MQLNRDLMMTRGKTYIQGKHQYGFTLLEVLIALLVLAIGLLGLAALQTTGLRSNTMATTRTHATQLAYDIADRMRANVAGSYKIVADNVVDDIYKYYDLTTCVPTPTPTPTTATVDGAPTASGDLYSWCTAVKSTLPSGDAAISQVRQDGLDGTPNTKDDVVTYDVTVYWNEARIAGVNGKGCGPDLNVDLRCMQLNVTIPRPIANE